ncbi:MAG TPA: MFS transporter [Sphingomonas sp.]|nr:MFS transporter [Sphingomonas sp.]
MDRRWLALAVLTTARVSMGFQFQSLASAAPILVRDLGLGFADVGFLVGLYMLPGILLAVPGGWLGERFGDRRVVVVGLGLMVAGGLLAGLAPSYPLLVAGRALSGIGGVLLNVLMSKMITDWFVEHELVLAMAIFANAFPIGVGLALMSLGSLAERAGWAASLEASAAVAGAALLLVALVYRPHPNDGKARATVAREARISRREAAVVSLPGAIWGLTNGAYSILVSFAPILLMAGGREIGAAGRIVGGFTWLLVVTVQLGGLIAQRWGRRDLLMVGSIAGWCVALLLVQAVNPVVPLLACGVFMGLPVGVIMAMPASVLRPASRGVGMGIFYVFLYIGHAGLPPIAGAIQDWVGGTAASLYFAAALVFTVLPVFALFRWAQHRAVAAVARA